MNLFSEIRIMLRLNPTVATQLTLLTTNYTVLVNAANVREAIRNIV